MADAACVCYMRLLVITTANELSSIDLVRLRMVKSQKNATFCINEYAAGINFKKCLFSPNNYNFLH